MRHLITVILLLFASTQAVAQQKTTSLDDDLIYRINFGSADDVKILLEKGANPNAASSDGEHAIEVAIGRDDEESAPIVKILLDKGANSNLTDKSGMSPLVNATINNKTAIVRSLLDANADFHVKSSNGRSLIDIARANKNDEIAKLIQDRLDKEAAARIDTTHTPEKFKELVHQYVFYSCAYQYWNFVLASRQEPDRDAEMNIQISNIRNDLVSIVGQLQKFYPHTPQNDLKTVADNAAQQIYTILNDMVSNRNRKSKGVGTKDDANMRCQKFSDAVNIDFAPSVVNPGR